MPVAPSFQNFKFLTEPFIENGKNYIKAKNPSTGTVRKIRWYSDSEYAKAYGGKIKKETATSWKGSLKKIRGFEKGPIVVVRGNKTTEDEEWLRRSIARYAVGIGWHFMSTDIFPEDTPKHFKFLFLSWEEFRGEDDQHYKDPKILAEILNQKMKKKEWFQLK